MNAKLQEFTELLRTKHSPRHFLDRSISVQLLEELLEATRLSPSAFNLQPTHYVVVTEKSLKEKLYTACMNQSQIIEAGAVVVFTGDKNAAENNLEKILEQDIKAGAISKDYENLLRKNVPLSFSRKPFGLGWLWKFLAEVIVGKFIPIPDLQAVHKKYWLAKQVSISAMNFMLAAHTSGLATCPMEGFSERAVRKVLNIPKSHAVILVVPVGYADSSNKAKTRLPLKELVHYNSW